MSVVKGLLNKLLDLLVILILLVSLLFTIMAVSSRKDGVPSVFGRTFLTVQTDSMEPVLSPGDLIVGVTNSDNREYEVGDVVTFQMYVDRTAIYNTHRIIAKEDINGTYYYTTQGDNAAGADEGQIISGDIVSSYQGVRIPKLGLVMDYLQTQMGFFLCVLLPMIILFMVQLGGFVLNLIEYNKEKAAEAARAAAEEVAVALTEEEKQKAIREYLEGRSLQQAGGK